jgi:hypothetical protein
LQIFPNLVVNDYKLHVIVNGVVWFWLISTGGAMFKVVVCICDCESKSLLTIVCKLTFVTKWFEFGQYMARQVEVLGLLMTLTECTCVNVCLFVFL